MKIELQKQRKHRCCFVLLCFFFVVVFVLFLLVCHKECHVIHDQLCSCHSAFSWSFYSCAKSDLHTCLLHNVLNSALSLSLHLLTVYHIFNYANMHPLYLNDNSLSLSLHLCLYIANDWRSLHFVSSICFYVLALSNHFFSFINVNETLIKSANILHAVLQWNIINANIGKKWCSTRATHYLASHNFIIVYF